VNGNDELPLLDEFPDDEIDVAGVVEPCTVTGVVVVGATVVVVGGEPSSTTMFDGVAATVAPDA
jgi:hypothetical protein